MSSNSYTLNKAIRRNMIRDARPIIFKLRFSNPRYYIKTFIWNTQDDMIAGAAIVESPEYQACYIPLSPNDDPPCIGELHFNFDYLKPGVVSHELLHAIFDLAWKQRQIIRPPAISTTHTSKNYQYCEFLCGEIEHLTNQFWNKMPA